MSSNFHLQKLTFCNSPCFWGETRYLEMYMNFYKHGFLLFKYIFLNENHTELKEIL